MAKIQTRARAVDMLGRQQIAGIQTALSELFKNAHDAYATRATVDYFEGSGPKGQDFIVVRDDGIGMTSEDFLGKWLVLGTKVRWATLDRRSSGLPTCPNAQLQEKKELGASQLPFLALRCWS